MAMAAQFLQQSEFIGLAHRRVKWHKAEYNRILASLDHLPSEAAREALSGHKYAILELTQLLKRYEPDWGEEREITEKYLEAADLAPNQSARVDEPELQEAV